MADAPRLGVFFGLDEELYHQDMALGSSACVDLAINAPDYWFNSPLNPTFVRPEPTASQKFGTAAHKRILEGAQTFDGLYAPTEYPGNIKAGIQERTDIKAAGKIPIKREEWDRIQMMGAIITADPHLSEAFAGGAGSEVSIFWEREGIRFKCRIDKLKQKSSVDLKNTSPREGKSFRRHCLDFISNYRSEVQAELYREGRNQIGGFLKDGLVYGQFDEAKLAQVAAYKEFTWVWIFAKASGAPLLYGFTLSQRIEQTRQGVDGNLTVGTFPNPLYEDGRATIDAALANYKFFMENYGTESAWIIGQPLEEIQRDDLKPWRLDTE